MIKNISYRYLDYDSKYEFERVNNLHCKLFPKHLPYIACEKPKCLIAYTEGADDIDDIMGYLAIHYYDEEKRPNLKGWCALAHIGVDEQFRHNGVAKDLFEIALETLKLENRVGILALVGEDNEASIGLCENVGLVNVQKYDDIKCGTSYLMGKTLAKIKINSSICSN